MKHIPGIFTVEISNTAHFYVSSYLFPPPPHTHTLSVEYGRAPRGMSHMYLCVWWDVVAVASPEDNLWTSTDGKVQLEKQANETGKMGDKRSSSASLPEDTQPILGHRYKLCHIIWKWNIKTGGNGSLKKKIIWFLNAMCSKREGTKYDRKRSHLHYV